MSTSIGLPSFSTIHVEEYQHHLEQMLKNHLQEIEKLLHENHQYTWQNLMQPLDDLEDELEQSWLPISQLHSTVDSKALRDCYNACLPLLSAYQSAIGQNSQLYQAIKSIDKHHLDSAQQKIIDDSLLGFELSGVALSQKDKKRFEVIQARLDELSNEFSNHVLDAAQAFSINITDEKRLAGVPAHALHAAQELAKEKGFDGYILNLEYPCYVAVVTYAQDRALREEMYQAYMTRASDQGPNAGTYDNSALIDEILALRHEKAQLLGFANYAELSLAVKMANSTDQVLGFIDDLVTKAYQQGKEEYEELAQFAKEHCQLADIQPWDIPFVSEKRRQALYDISQEELRPYFPQPKVMEGLFSVVHKLYGMTIEEIKGVDTWHPDVQCYCVVDEENQVRGYIYTDLFARQNKRGGAWMSSLRSRRRLADGTIQTPIATLNCNFAKATKNKPATLSHDELNTLFHEFGHCLHHILTKVDYLSASGINGVEWDAVELPSQFFEQWAWDQKSLSLLSSHVDTGKQLPDKLYNKMIKAKNFQSAMAMLRQLEFGLFDFLIHKQFKTGDAKFVADTIANVRKKTTVVPVTPNNRFQHSFTHIFAGGYAAGYYSYMWAEVLSSDAFSRFEEEGIFNPKTGHDFLHCILEVGGSMKASEAFRRFRGRDADVNALLRHNGINS